MKDKTRSLPSWYKWIIVALCFLTVTVALGFIGGDFCVFRVADMEQDKTFVQLLSKEYGMADNRLGVSQISEIGYYKLVFLFFFFHGCGFASLSSSSSITSSSSCTSFTSNTSYLIRVTSPLN